MSIVRPIHISRAVLERGHHLLVSEALQTFLEAADCRLACAQVGLACAQVGLETASGLFQGEFFLAQACLETTLLFFPGEFFVDESRPRLPLKCPGSLRILCAQGLKVLPGFGRVIVGALGIAIHKTQIEQGNRTSPTFLTSIQQPLILGHETGVVTTFHGHLWRKAGLLPDQAGG
jgi:hypothetical protein